MAKHPTKTSSRKPTIEVNHTCPGADKVNTNLLIYIINWIARMPYDGADALRNSAAGPDSVAAVHSYRINWHLPETTTPAYTGGRTGFHNYGA